MSDEKQWYVRTGESEPVGPVTSDQLKRGFDSGKVPEGSVVQRVGSSEPWMPVTDVLAEAVGPRTTSCPDCGGMVSKRAAACPHCGAPMSRDPCPETGQPPQGTAVPDVAADTKQLQEDPISSNAAQTAGQPSTTNGASSTRKRRNILWIALGVGVAVLIVASVIVIAVIGHDQKLSKEEAKQKIEAKYYNPGVVYCSWRSVLKKQGTGKDSALIPLTSNTTACVDQMQKQGLVERIPCFDTRLYTGEVKCPDDRFQVSGKNVGVDGAYLYFPCGHKTLLEVLAIATAGNGAMVKYKRSVSLDMGVLKALERCSLDTPSEGVEEKTVEFIRDDNGIWSERE